MTFPEPQTRKLYRDKTCNGLWFSCNLPCFSQPIKHTACTIVIKGQEKADGNKTLNDNEGYENVRIRQSNGVIVDFVNVDLSW